jgi:peptidyl-prolyl cis-trans isomerase-like 3
MSVTIHTTLGQIKVEIFCDLAPRTSFNFLSLAATGAYTNSIFHRNIPGFMIQGGSPSTSGGKGGDSIWGDVDMVDEFHPELRHDRRGMISMANKGSNTNRSQFFLTYERAPHLNDVYSVFGKVIDGFDVLDQMERLQSTGKKDRPVGCPVIRGVEIHSNPLADEGIVYPAADGPPVQTST